MDHSKIQRLTEQRETEWQEVQQYLDAETCLMSFLRSALDDPETEKCGKCSNCTHAPILGPNVNHALCVQAAYFLRHAEIPLKLNAQVATDAFVEYGFRGNLPKKLRAEQGKLLSRWGDAGWGTVVADNKHKGHFQDELVNAVAEMIQIRWRPDNIQWITYVPSHNHPDLVPDFAKRLAKKMGLPLVEAIIKIRDNQQQKLQQNRFHQCRNLDGVFQVKNIIAQHPVLLVDDVVDSGWTMTVIAALLKQAGSGPVFPVALATTSPGG